EVYRHDALCVVARARVDEPAAEDPAGPCGVEGGPPGPERGAPARTHRRPVGRVAGPRAGEPAAEDPAGPCGVEADLGARERGAPARITDRHGQRASSDAVIELVSKQRVHA